MLALTLHKRLLEIGATLVLKPSSVVPRFIQADASYEVMDGHVVAGIGGMLFDPTGRAVKFVSHKLDESVVAALNPGLQRKTTIFECEFFAVLCALWLWGNQFSDADVIYTGNNGVRDTLISCNTRNKVARDILTATLAVESMSQITPWYARVQNPH